MTDEPKKFGDLLPPSVTPEPSVYRAPSLPSLGRPVDKEGAEGDDCTIVEQTRQFLPQLLSQQSLDFGNEPTADGALDAFRTEMSMATQELVDESRVFAALGEEADNASCEVCSKTRPLNQGICCESCGAFYCRQVCWPKHNCGVMNDWDGRIVKVGDYLKYVDGNQTLWTVVSIPGSYVRIHAAIGRRKDGREIPIKPRLMRLQ